MIIELLGAYYVGCLGVCVYMIATTDVVFNFYKIEKYSIELSEF